MDEKQDMPVFQLKASDITADLMVELWVEIQRYIGTCIKSGATPEQAVKDAWDYLGPSEIVGHLTDKQRGALAIAEAMRAYSPRKLAD